MKKLIYTICLIIIACFVHACTVQQPISYAPAENNADYQISYLFEHDGCKVYRFYDDGRYVYFTTINSDVTVIPNDSTVITNTVRTQ
ncbi:DUF4884 domain-containing protein [Carboxylicivirga sp. A043]|uniref:DUF4884 domain-containing protein n=1 Tax=Carboxylicivirga litoralis TaxID=2816963 RepID=UPI0021CB6364|nr:DUF4884 domain-containing protein [Carboxylicivirga sp. A043]MCU4155433.1 DUF4884 domain-containing protein [Carboxylicivirga sp. A043]